MLVYNCVCQSETYWQEVRGEINLFRLHHSTALVFTDGLARSPLPVDVVFVAEQNDQVNGGDAVSIPNFCSRSLEESQQNQTQEQE